MPRTRLSHPINKLINRLLINLSIYSLDKDIIDEFVTFLSYRSSKFNDRLDELWCFVCIGKREWLL